MEPEISQSFIYFSRVNVHFWICFDGSSYSFASCCLLYTSFCFFWYFFSGHIWLAFTRRLMERKNIWILVLCSPWWEVQPYQPRICGLPERLLIIIMVGSILPYSLRSWPGQAWRSLIIWWGLWLLLLPLFFPLVWSVRCWRINQERTKNGL